MKLSVMAWISILILPVTLLACGIYLGLNQSMIWLIVAAFFAIVLIISLLVTIKAEKKEKFCSNCGKAYSLSDVEYHEVSRQVKTLNYDPNKSSKQVVERLVYKIGFDCTCSECKTTKSYVKSYNGGQAYSDGSVKYKNPNDNIEKYFRNPTLSFNESKSIVLSFFFAVVIVVATIAIEYVSAFLF